MRSRTLFLVLFSFIVLIEVLVVDPGFGEEKLPRDQKSYSSPQKKASKEEQTKRSKATATFEITLARYLKNHDRAKAREGFLQVLQEDPNYSAAYYNLGILSMADEDWDKAVDWFTRFRIKDPSSKQSVKAQLLIDKIGDIKEQDRTPEGKRNRQFNEKIEQAKLLYKAGLFKEAILECGQATLVDKSRWESYALGALILSKQREYSQAVSLVNNAIEFAPKDKRDLLKKTKERYQKEIKFDALMVSGKEALKAKHFVAASNQFYDAWSIFPSRGDAGLALAASASMAGQYEKSKQVLLKIQLNSDPDISRKAREMLATLVARKAIGHIQDSAEEEYEKGMQFVQKQDYFTAASWFLKSAEKGYSLSQAFLGEIYAIGHDGVKKDYKKALKWLRLAADQNNASAQNNLGFMYGEGKGVAQSYQEAVKWFRKAADQGLADAQRNLGLMYQHGKGVAQSDQEAVKWFRKAADQGNKHAQTNLGLMYQQGRGVTQSNQEAMMWFRKAADQGDDDAQKLLREILQAAEVPRK